MAQSVNHLTFGFSSGHDLVVRGIEHDGLCTMVGSLLQPLSLCPSPNPARACTLALSLSQINIQKAKKERKEGRKVGREKEEKREKKRRLLMIKN